MSMPNYIDLPGSQTYPPPFRMQNVNVQIFLLRASYERLIFVTDNWLNRMPDRPYNYVPLLPFVACIPTWTSRITASDPDWSKRGWMHESELGFAYVVAAFKGLEIDHLAIVTPYLIVDNPATLTAGREIFGYRKVFGTMTYNVGTYQPLAASTWVFPRDLPDEEYGPAQIAAVNQPPAWGAATRQANLKNLEQIAELVVGDIGLDIAIAIEHLIAYFKTLELRSAFLLQLRDVVDPKSAAYQALIEASQQITSLNSAWLLPPGFSIQLSDYPSYPVVSDLGIEVDANNVAQSLLSFQVNYDCILTTGTALAVAGRSSPT